MHEGSEGRYVHGCRCRPCLDAHAAVQREYRAGVRVREAQMKAEFAAMQIELEQLRQWRDMMFASAPLSGSPQ